MELPLWLCLYSVPYFVFVLPAYRLVRHYGRPYHRSDWAALTSPLLVYAALQSYHNRQGVNAIYTVPIIGAVVALCVLFRGWRLLSPWIWSVGTGALGITTAIIVWLGFGLDPLLGRLF
jgi:hypothetical protein